MESPFTEFEWRIEGGKLASEEEIDNLIKEVDVRIK